MKSLSDYEQKIDRLSENCPVRAAIDVIRGRWKPSILFELKAGTRRFSDGVVARNVCADIPVRIEYALSEYGTTLSGVMDQLEEWGEKYPARRSTPESAPARGSHSHSGEPVTILR